MMKPEERNEGKEHRSEGNNEDYLPQNLLVKVRHHVLKNCVHRGLRNQRLLIQKCKRDRKEQKIVCYSLASLLLK